MSWSESALVSFVQERFAALADADKAGPMAAYMKTEMPFYGIQKPDRIPVYREMKAKFVPQDREQYERAVLALWKLPHREEKYAAIEYAKQNTKLVRADSLPMYLRLVREGAWWDFVDDIAINLVGHAYLADRDVVRNQVESWVSDSDMWIRRTALICHNHHREKTDSKQLFDHCLRLADEKEFFIRKAIGWALREYSYANPDGVRAFLTKNRGKLSPLSYNEGCKRLAKLQLI